MAALLTPPGFASLDGVITGTGKPFAANSCKQVTWFTTYTAGDEPTQGTVIIEHAVSADYAGVWNQIGSITLTDVVAGTGGFGTYPGVIAFIRARVTSDSDEAISVYFNGLQEV